MGFPYTTEAIGFAYNADILEKCGVDPTSITTPAALKSAIEAVDAKKDQLGLKAVVGYCAEPENLGWSSGNHLFGAYIDSGKYAFVTQGSWIGATLSSSEDYAKAGSFSLGMVPYAFESEWKQFLPAHHPGGQYQKKVMLRKPRPFYNGVQRIPVSRCC